MFVELKKRKKEIEKIKKGEEHKNKRNEVALSCAIGRTVSFFFFGQFIILLINHFFGHKMYSCNNTVKIQKSLKSGAISF